MLSEPVIPSSHSVTKRSGEGNWQCKPSRCGHWECCQSTEIGIKGARSSTSAPGKRRRESRSLNTRIVWRTGWPEIFDCHWSSKNLSEMGGKSAARKARQTTKSEFCEAEVGWMSWLITAYRVCATKESSVRRQNDWSTEWFFLPVEHYSSLPLWLQN